LTNRIFHADRESILNNNKLVDPSANLPIFDQSKIFLLETLGEGGFGIVQKAYDKSANEFVALKKFKSVLSDNKNEVLNDIMLEDALLQSVEKIRRDNPNCNQYFLKYDGVFKDANDQSDLILKMENGCATLEDIINAGKVFPCDELLYVTLKLVQAFCILQDNGIANRDVKTQNVILVEDPLKKTGFFFKISDFGIGCQLTKNTTKLQLDSLKGMTNAYAAPEVSRFFEDESSIPESKSLYNPFLADVYSLGLIILKMINKKWGKKDLQNGLLCQKEKFEGYDDNIVNLLKGILEEDEEKRWDFKKILQFFSDVLKKTGSTLAPTDLSDYYHKWQVEFKEKKQEKTWTGLGKLYQEHKNLYLAYERDVTRPNESKFHLDRAWEIVQKMNKLNEGDQKTCEKGDDIMESTIFCWKAFGDWNMKMGNLPLSEENLEKSLENIHMWELQMKERQTQNPLEEEKKEPEEEKIDVEGNANTVNSNKDEEIKRKINSLEADVFGSFGNLYKNMSNFNKAEDFYLKCLKIRQNLFGENHPDVALSFNNLGLLYYNSGDFSKTEEFYGKSLKIYQNLYGENHSDVATSFNNLGLFYKNAGHLNIAEEFYLKSLKIRLNLFGENHADVALSLNNLGALHENRGNLNKAEEFYLKSLKIRQDLFCENHPDVAQSFNNLGVLYENQGNLVKAEEFKLKSSKIFQDLYGENHSTVALSFNNLGALYYKMGNLNKAEEVYLKSLKIRQNLFGENHSDVALSFNNLGALYFNIGNLNKAEESYLRSLKIYQNLFDENNPNLANSFNNLGLLYDNMGNFNKAEEFYLKSLKINQNLFGENHSTVALSFNNLGALYYKKGNLNTAEEFYLKSLKIRQSLFGENHSDVAQSYNNLAYYYEQTKNSILALNYAKKAYDITLSLFGDSHPNTVLYLNHYQKLLLDDKIYK